MWELDCEESWAQKNWCFWTVVLEKTLESPFDCKEIQPVHSKGDQPWVFIGRTDGKAKTPILWPPREKSWLIGKDPDAGKDWRWEKKGNDRGWDGWMASPTQWTRVWVNSRSWWWTGRPGVLQFMGWQTVGHDWATELSWTEGQKCLLPREGGARKKIREYNNPQNPASPMNILPLHFHTPQTACQRNSVQLLTWDCLLLPWEHPFP